jgi:uncharacterized protein YjiS (DUF1127 family)
MKASASKLTFWIKRNMQMFRKIYRALILSRTKSAAIQVANQLSNHDLNDMGHSRFDIVNVTVESVRKELDQADLERAQKTAAGTRKPSFWSEANVNSLLRQLSSTRSVG